MQRLMFVANSRMILSGMVFAIDELLANEKIATYGITLVCDGCYYETDKYEVINLSDKTINNTQLGTQTRNVNTFYNQERRRLRKQIWQFFYNFKAMSIDDKKSKEILNAISPDALIIGCDRMGGVLQGFLKNAKNIPIIKLPVAMQNDYRKCFGSRYFDCELALSDKIFDMNRILFRINKSWVRRIGNESRVFYPLGYTLAGWVKGMVSMHPWVSGAGKSTFVLAASEDEKEMVLAEAHKNVIVTGMLEDYYILQCGYKRDEISYNMRKKYGLEGKKVVVFSLPQISEHNWVSWDIHRNNMKQLVQIINRAYGKFLVSLHPKSNRESYEYLCEYAEFSFLEERLREVIGGIDILISVSNSSVTHWAHMLNIGSVIIDLKDLCDNISLETINKLKASMLLQFDNNQNKEEKYAIPQNIKDVANEILLIVEGKA